jgi:hypothetical protein
VSEPTLAEVLAAVQAVARTQSAHGEAIASLTAGQSSLAERLDAGFLATGARFDLVDARQVEAGQVLETLSGMAYDQQQAIVRAEARLTSRVSDVQQVVQTLKADLAAHTSDPQVHDHRG